MVQKFAVGLCYGGQPSAKIKIDLVTESPKMQNFLRNILQPRLEELAVEAVSTQSTNPSWKGKTSKIKEELPSFLKEGKAFTKDGVSGKYDPSFSLTIPKHREEELKRMEAQIASYVPPPPEEVNKGYNDSAEAYLSALRKSPPCTWNVKLIDSEGAPVPAGKLLERRAHKCRVMFSLKSIMLKPIRVLSIQAEAHQFRLSPEEGGRRKRADHSELDKLWKKPRAEEEEAGEEEEAPAAAAAPEEDAGAISD